MPFTPILMGVSMLQSRSDLDPQVRETLETIRRNVEMEARLIDDLLDLTRIERGKVELQKQRVELRTIIQQAVEVCRPDSEGKGQGATFRVRLPAAVPLDTPGPSSAAASVQHGSSRPLRVLLVEDHEVTAQMLRMALTAEGHDVETAGAVAAALHLANQQTFDVLISDLGLPDGTGHDLICQLRSQGHAFPGIALSGYGQEADVQRSLEAGFAAHLIKPASREQLIEAIAQAIAPQSDRGAPDPDASAAATRR